MHSRPPFVHKARQRSIAETPAEELSDQLVYDLLPASLTIPVHQQYIVYGSLEIPNGMTVDAIGSLVVL